MAVATLAIHNGSIDFQYAYVLSKTRRLHKVLYCLKREQVVRFYARTYKRCVHAEEVFVFERV
jgi:hypothetical protein